MESLADLIPSTSTSRINSLEALAKQFHSAVHRRARQILGNEDDAADIAQEVFLRALRAREVALQPHPLAWLYRVTTNLCLNRLRDSRRRDRFLSQAADESDGDQTGASETSTLLELLSDVPPDLLSPAVYYYVEGLSHEEIAAKMNVSRRTVGNRIVAFHTFVREQARASNTPKHVPSMASTSRTARSHSDDSSR